MQECTVCAYTPCGMADNQQKFLQPKDSAPMAQISAVDPAEIVRVLLDAKRNKARIQVVENSPEKRERKTYLFKVGFPKGLKAGSVSAWFSTDYRNDKIYMSNSAFADYISAVISGNGGKGKSTVTIIQKEEGN